MKAAFKDASLWLVLALTGVLFLASRVDAATIDPFTESVYWPLHQFDYIPTPVVNTERCPASKPFAAYGNTFVVTHCVNWFPVPYPEDVSIAFSRKQVGPVEPVPLPGAAWLMLSALGSLVVLRRRGRHV